jgi:adenosylcobinamide-phosphate synthase
MRIYAHLKAGDIPQARQALAMMVSRDTDESNEQDIIKGTIESLSENINDSIIAPLVFAALLGPLGAIGYRVCNTLDAMWGYRTEKYEQFGKFSAKVDDVLNYIPSRLGAFWIALAGSIRKNSSMRQTLSIVKRDAHKHPSPNSGQCETAMAAVLQIQLGGPCKYHGKMMDRDTIGNGTVALTVTHIAEASQILLTTAALHAVAMIGIRLFL